MNHSSPLPSRRVFLKSIGACLALPSLESIGSSQVGVETPLSASNRARLLYLYFPNGTAEGSWGVEKTRSDGRIQSLNQWMAPLDPFKEDLIVPKNLWTPRGNGHGGGTATWLTGGSFDGRKNNAGGVSADQIAARHLRGSTPLPSLELSVAGEGFFSNCLVRNSLSWITPNTPALRETEPRVLFDKMFRGLATTGAPNTQKTSVIDLVQEQAKSLSRRASSLDKEKIDEYLTAVREIEQRMEFAEAQSRRIADDDALNDTLTRPKAGIPAQHEEYLQQMMELLALALWSGATRVGSFMLDHGQSNRYFNFIPEVQGTWHALSHWRDASGKTEDDDGKTSWSSAGAKREMYNRVSRWHHQQVAYLLGRLKHLKEVDGSPLLDHSMVVYGSSLADGHEHEAENLPVLIAGGKAHGLQSGRGLDFRRNTSMSKLHFSLLQAMGVPIHRFAETSDPLPGLRSQ